MPSRHRVSILSKYVKVCHEGAVKRSVSHLLHTQRSRHLRTFLDKLGNVEGEVLDCLIALNVILPGCDRPDAIVVFLQPSPPLPPGLGVGATPVRAHTLFPQIPPGLLPMVVKEGENLLQMIVVKCS